MLFYTIKYIVKGLKDLMMENIKKIGKMQKLENKKRKKWRISLKNGKVGVKKEKIWKIGIKKGKRSRLSLLKGLDLKKERRKRLFLLKRFRFKKKRGMLSLLKGLN